MKRYFEESSNTGFDPYEHSNNSKSTRELLIMAVHIQYELKAVKEDIENYLKATQANTTTTQLPEPEERWLNSKEVCRQLNISERKLQYLRSEGKIRFLPDGNRCKYKQDYIDEYVRDNWKTGSKKDTREITKIKNGYKKRKAG
jgi:excisionase family DNA binding protein